MRRTSIWGLLGAVGATALVLSTAISLPAVGQDAVSATVSGAATYSELLRRAEATARTRLAEIFKSGADSARVTINGKNGSSLAPILDVSISQADWRKKPASLRPYSNYYDAASLLGYSQTPAVAATPVAPGTPAGKSDRLEPGVKDSTAQTAGVLKLDKSNPAEGEERFKINRTIELTFATELTTKSGEDLGIKLEPSAGGQATIAKNTVTFLPSNPLAYSRKYTLKIEGSKKFKLPGPITINFKTEPQYTYEKNIRPMVAGTCTSCHSQRGSARTSPLDSYEGVLQFVAPGQGGQILDYTGYHGQTRTGAFGTGVGLSQGQQPTIPTGGTGIATNPNGVPGNPTGLPTGLYRPPTLAGSSGVNINRRSAAVPTQQPPTDEEGNVADDGSGAVARSPVTRGGALNEQQVAILRTWIVQDQAIER